MGKISIALMAVLLGGCVSVGDIEVANTSGIERVMVASNGQFIEQHRCEHGRPDIIVMPAAAATKDSATAMTAFQAYAEDDGVGYIARLRVNTADGWVFPEGQEGRVVVMLLCQG